MKEFPVFCIIRDTKPSIKQLNLWTVSQQFNITNSLQLENSMAMYGIFNAETLEQLINTVHCIQNTTSSNERLFAGQES